MVSTRLRWRVFRPWIEKPCSRVLRKLSGELTTIQYWADRPPPDLRFRLDRPDLAGLGSSGGDGSTSSDTLRRLLAVHSCRWDWAEVLRLREQGAEVADLRHVGHLMLRHQPADVEQARLASAWICDGPLPLGRAPTVEQVDRSAADPREVLERLLEGKGQILVVAGVDGGAHVGRLLAVEVRVAEEAVDFWRTFD